MKKILTLLALLSLTSAAFGQITILSTDMPVPTGSYNISDMTNPTLPSNPIIGTNITWDYGIYNGTTYTEDYFPETDTFFTNGGVDVNYPTGKTMVPGTFFYNLNSEIDFTTTNVRETGIYIPYQGYDLSAATGNTGDSMEIPEQRYFLSTPATLINFPLSNGNAWHSVSRYANNFTLTLSPLFDHSPWQHVYYTHSDDTIVGWGKMRVYAISGPSIYYDVLMEKSSQYSVDSFYANGLPADATVLGSFGMSQNQHTDSQYSYNFYRKGSFNYLAEFDYFNDASFNTLDGAYYHTDNIDPSGIKSLNGALYSTVIFPNPAKHEINLKVVGGDLKMSAYVITDITGKAVKSGNVVKGATQLHVDLDGSLVNGVYILNVLNEAGEVLVKESFVIN